VPYRAGGRDPVTGLDCLGVVAASLASAGWHAQLPLRGPLRQRASFDAARIAQDAGLVNATSGIIPGDILLLRCSSTQRHLLIATDAQQFVHAHASLRRVVLSVLDPAWRFAAHWRLPLQR
jgi:cell wall-associated NlpC family hydrolase